MFSENWKFSPKNFQAEKHLQMKRIYILNVVRTIKKQRDFIDERKFKLKLNKIRSLKWGANVERLPVPHWRVCIHNTDSTLKKFRKKIHFSIVSIDYSH